MKTILLAGIIYLAGAFGASANPRPTSGTASWYGESHRGRLMANGRRFDPDKLTAASWFYPLGTRLRITSQERPGRGVLVTVTDRGPAKELVRGGRIIDLAESAFKKLAPLEL